MNALEIWLRIMMVSRLPVKNALKFVNELILMKKINNTALQYIGLNEKQSLEFLHAPADQINTTLKWLEHPHHHILPLTHPHYPYLLKQIHRPPLVLFVAGSSEILSTAQIAIIGSRNASRYGQLWAEKFTRAFVEHQFTITSGLAFGIDSIGHRTALESKGKTIAVLGSGLNCIYPQQHKNMALQIIEQGALVSEFGPNTPPLAKNFPRRNRIISGLSRAVVVIEAGMQSGSLITARYALEQNRDLFTLPGSLGNAQFSGNHWLIQQGAYLLTEVQDLLSHIQSELEWTLPQASLKYAETDMIDNSILDIIDYQATAVDVIVHRSQRSITELLPELIELELAGKISSVVGGYIKID